MLCLRNLACIFNSGTPGFTGATFQCLISQHILDNAVITLLIPYADGFSGLLIDIYYRN